MRTKTLWIREDYLNWILQGVKTIELEISRLNQETKS